MHSVCVPCARANGPAIRSMLRIHSVHKAPSAYAPCVQREVPVTPQNSPLPGEALPCFNSLKLRGIVTARGKIMERPFRRKPVVQATDSQHWATVSQRQATDSQQTTTVSQERATISQQNLCSYLKLLMKSDSNLRHKTLEDNNKRLLSLLSFVGKFAP